MIEERILPVLGQGKVGRWVLLNKQEALTGSVCHLCPAAAAGGVPPRHLTVLTLTLPAHALGFRIPRVTR